jgi:hypothetical protein
MKRKTISPVLVVLLALFISLSCAAPFTPEASGPLQQTQGALAFQATGLVLQAQQATLDAARAGVAPAAPAGVPTFTPLPTFTIAPAAQPPAATSAPVAAPPQDLKTRIKKANVLIFEDIYGYPPLAGNTRVSMAVSRMNFSGGTVLNTKDAYGNFKSELNSSAKWDLIVVSAESREGMKGEFWDYLYDQVDRGVGLVAEVYNLNNIANGRISNIMSRCGIAFQKDWERPQNYDINDYSILLLDPGHDIFTIPNPKISLVTPNSYWIGDAGDFLRLTGNGDAQMLAGLYQSHKSDYGVLASCIEGRFVFQTFSTHDYRQDQTVPLWQNMMTYALTNHFKYMDQQPK